MHDDARAARARLRASWKGEVLTEQTPAQLPTPEARLASMWQLALDSFGDCQRLDRGSWPGVVIRP